MADLAFITLTVAFFAAVVTLPLTDVESTPHDVARRRRQPRGHHVHHPAAEPVLDDLPDRQPLQIQQPRRARIRHRGRHMDVRTLGQARDLCSSTMNCSTQP